MITIYRNEIQETQDIVSSIELTFLDEVGI